jgi:hypothetical protein
VSILLHAIVYVFLHNLLNVLVQITNNMGLQKKIELYRKRLKQNLYGNDTNFNICTNSDSIITHK